MLAAMSLSGVCVCVFSCYSVAGLKEENKRLANSLKAMEKEQATKVT